MLKTKLHVPDGPARYVPRPRLLDRLHGALRPGHRLTVLAAPAGYGKTALLSAWLAAEQSRSREVRVAWLSLDDGDNDVVRFWRGLIASLAESLKRPDFAAESLGVLQSPGPTRVDAIMAGVVNELADVVSPTVIALDDYHLIQAAAVHGSLSALIERLPPAVHVVLATRAEPPIGLARLRVRGQLLELGPTDLRFRPDEVTAFLQAWLGDLGAVDVAQLEARTEGWAAGLQLAALALQSAGSAAERQAFVRSFAGSQRFVLDYLIEEVLQHQPLEVQSFLLNTSILSRWSVETAAALLEPPTNSVTHAAAIVEQLDRASLFLIPLDAERLWFRYHHLFAEALRSRLARSGAEHVAALHRRAADWFERAGHPEPAIDHALSAGDAERAQRLIREQARPLMIRGELATLLNWEDALPAHVRDTDPRLMAERGMALLFSGRLDEAEALAERCEALLGDSDSADARHVRGIVATQRAFAADLRGDFAAALAQVERADAHLPHDDRLARSVLPYVRGRASLAVGDLARAEEDFAAMAKLAQLVGNVWTVSVAVGQQVFAARLRGRLRIATDAIAQAQRAVAARGEQAYGPAGLLESMEASLCHERGDSARALALFATALPRLRGWGNPAALTSALWAGARVQLAQGDLAGSEQLLNEAEAIASRTPVAAYTRAALAAERASLWLAQARLDDAARWADAPQRFEADGPANDLLALAVARVRIATGRADEAVEPTRSLAEAARSTGRAGTQLDALVVLAAALEAVGDRPGALAALEQALRLAEPEECVRPFVTDGGQLRDVLLALSDRWKRRNDAERYPLAFAARLLGILPASTRQGSQAGDTAQALAEPLSARELEVLRLVDAGLTNREIAERLVVTVATAKKHIENLNGKLGVHSRTQALARARELGLI